MLPSQVLALLDTSTRRPRVGGNVAGLIVPERMNSNILKASRRSVYRLEAYATSGDAQTLNEQQQQLLQAYRLLQLHLLEPRQALLVHTLLALQVLEMQLLLLPDLLANLLAQTAQHSLLLLDGIGGLGHLGLHLLNLLLCVDRTGQLQENGNIGRDWIDHTPCWWALTRLLGRSRTVCILVQRLHESSTVFFDAALLDQTTHALRTAEDDLVIVLALRVVHALVVLWVCCHDDGLRGVHHPQGVVKSCVQEPVLVPWEEYLVAEVAVAAHDLHVEVDVTTAGGVVNEGETECIGTTLVNAVWECLLLPLGCALDLLRGKVTNLQLVVTNQAMAPPRRKEYPSRFPTLKSVVCVSIEVWTVLHLHIECRYLVTPPELTRQTPIVNVLHPSSVLPLRSLGLDLDGAIGHSIQSWLCKGFH
ncbi:hypothetical protein KC349_g241 [Hortaea werneckii]|nr:hypothetical protein KC349_g241 [Hortaea werneckii]